MSMWIAAPVIALFVYAFSFRSLEQSERPSARRLGSWGIVLASVIACVLIQLQRAHFGGLRPPRIALDLLLMTALPAPFPIEAMWLARFLTRRRCVPLWLYLIAFMTFCSILWAVTACIGLTLNMFVRL